MIARSADIALQALTIIAVTILAILFALIGAIVFATSWLICAILEALFPRGGLRPPARVKRAADVHAPKPPRRTSAAKLRVIAGARRR